MLFRSRTESEGYKGAQTYKWMVEEDVVEVSFEDHLLPYSAVTGAFLVLAADTLGRNAFSPTTVPVGIVVSYVGVPLFLYLILRERRKSL